jgi:hypothetical protein
VKDVFVLATVVFAVACTGTQGGRAPSALTDSPPLPVERACDSAVVGDVNTTNATRVGPLVLVGVSEAARLPRSAFRSRRGRYSAIKILAVVTGSSDVTVTVPPDQRDSVLLLYDPAARANRYGFLPSQGEPSVTFDACAGTKPQYNGGFIALKPICARVDVTSAGETRVEWISLGAGAACPA